MSEDEKWDKLMLSLDIIGRRMVNARNQIHPHLRANNLNEVRIMLSTFTEEVREFESWIMKEEMR